MTDLAIGATLPVVRALLDEAKRKNYRSGVLGIRTKPVWSGSDTFAYDDTTVTVATCVSSLAVREALLERQPGQWLVVLTDRSDADLGAGVLSHLAFHRLRTPDPWEVVRVSFAATGIDPALTTAQSHRELAAGLLAAAPPRREPDQPPWPPAPGGVLTLDHALGSVAAAHLGLGDPVVDATTVLTWTADETVPARLADLRSLAGDVLVDAVLGWAARAVGAASVPIEHLLRAGAGADALPLGLVVGLLDGARDSTSPVTVSLAGEALVRLEPRLGVTKPPSRVLRGWASESTAVVSALLLQQETLPAARRLLARADVLLVEAQAAALADASDLLPSGLTRRLERLATALRDATSGGGSDTVPAARGAVVEQVWASVAAHRLAGTGQRTVAFHAAVRLVRWLASAGADTSDTQPPSTMRSLIARQTDEDAWVDSAVNDAARGADDPELAAALAAVLRLTRVRRDQHDREFAAALAVHTDDDPSADADGLHRGVAHLEDLLAQTVMPLARTTPVLLLVLDGMSVGVGHEVLADVLDGSGGWAEALLPGRNRRAAALAVLPTLTEVSRASLLSGELRTGGQDVEQRGYRALAIAHGLVGASLFHKKPLDSTRPGYAVADDVGAAIDDVAGQPLVTCVLNTIDDALDRSDPSGTDWGQDAVRHLEPLLTRARYAGRTVVLTADHGHIVERREGTMRSQRGSSNNRYRAVSEPVGPDEVLVTGRRVLTADNRAVLAVDERLRYGPLKAGYHGGAAPAEAVVPVTVLVGGEPPAGTDLRPAPPQEPVWWSAPLGTAVTPAPTPSLPGASFPASTQKAKPALPTLFDELPDEPMPAGSDANALATAVVQSPTYVEQSARTTRIVVSTSQVTALLSALLASPSRRLPAPRAAVALAVPLTSLRGAVPHVQRLLNVEGYGVLTVDADGSTLVLDADLLMEQFEVTGTSRSPR